MMAEFWTVFDYGGSPSVCSKHSTEQAAQRAACKCEQRGGARHVILKVSKVRRRKARPASHVEGSRDE